MIFVPSFSQGRMLRPCFNGVDASGSTVPKQWGFSGSTDRMALFLVRPNPRRAAIWENSNGDISAADHPIYSVFGSRMGFSGSADRMGLIPV